MGSPTQNQLNYIQKHNLGSANTFEEASALISAHKGAGQTIAKASNKMFGNNSYNKVPDERKQTLIVRQNCSTNASALLPLVLAHLEGDKTTKDILHLHDTISEHLEKRVMRE